MLHVESPVIVLRFRLRTEDHQEELLVRIVRESLRVAADFLKKPLIHQIDDRSQVSGVSGESIRCPGQNSREHAFADIFQ